MTDPNTTPDLTSKIHDAFQNSGGLPSLGSQFQTSSTANGQTAYQFVPKSPVKRPSTGFWRKAVAGVAGLAVIAMVGVGGVALSNQLNSVDTDSRSQASAYRVPTLQVGQPQPQANGSVVATVTYDGSLLDTSSTVSRLEATITVTRSKAAPAPTFAENPNTAPGSNTDPILKTFEGFQVVGLSPLFEFTRLDIVPSTTNPLAYQVMIAAKVKNPTDATVRRQLAGRLQLLSLESKTGQSFLAQLDRAQFWGFLKRAPGVEVLLGRPSLSVPKVSPSPKAETQVVPSAAESLLPGEQQPRRPSPTPMPPEDLPGQVVCGNQICEPGEADQENCPSCAPGVKVCPKYACTMVPGSCPADCK